MLVQHARYQLVKNPIQCVSSPLTDVCRILKYTSKHGKGHIYYLCNDVIKIFPVLT